MRLIIFISIFITGVLGTSYNNIMLDKIKIDNQKRHQFSFAVLGDNRDGKKVFKKIIHSINNDKDIKFSLNNGDLISKGSKREFSDYIKQIKILNQPLISIIGNHEIPSSNSKLNYKTVFGKLYFSFQYENTYFIILDTADKHGLGKKQRSWLIQELKKSKKFKNRFVFMHMPLYDPRKGKLKEGHSILDSKNAKKLNKIFDKYKVSMLFTSHIHMYYRGKWRGTPFIISGGGGAKLKKYKKHGFYHYMKVTVNGSNIKYEVIKMD